VRVVNRLLSVLLGLLLLALGLATIAWIVADATGHLHILPAPLTSDRAIVLGALGSASRTSLGGLLGTVVCALLVIAGLLVLFIELRPWPQRRLDLVSTEQLRWRIDRRSVERSLGHLLEHQTSAQRVGLKVGRRWQVRVIAEADPAARSELDAELHRELEQLKRGDSPIRLSVRQTRRVL
jgi:hypothetical protein